jgi:hypothetical protein
MPACYYIYLTAKKSKLKGCGYAPQPIDQFRQLHANTPLAGNILPVLQIIYAIWEYLRKVNYLLIFYCILMIISTIFLLYIE